MAHITEAPLLSVLYVFCSCEAPQDKRNDVDLNTRTWDSKLCQRRSLVLMSRSSTDGGAYFIVIEMSQPQAQGGGYAVKRPSGRDGREG